MLIAVAVVAVLVVGGCGAVGVLLSAAPGTPASEVGCVWRLSRLPIGSQTSLRGHALSDAAIGAARFSYLHWTPEGCEGGEPRLRRAERTPEQDEQSIDATIGRPSQEARSADAVQRVGAGS